MRSRKEERRQKDEGRPPHPRVELFPGCPPDTPTETLVTGLCYHDVAESDRVSLELWLYTDDAKRGFIKLRSVVLDQITVSYDLLFTVDPVTKLRTLSDYYYGPFPIPLPAMAFLMLREYGIKVTPGTFVGDTAGGP